jgi:mono/diheme cytochrome c family protein
MVHQAKDLPDQASGLFANGQVNQPPPAGTVARDAPERSRALTERPPLTAALLARGQERFAIYCTPCHGPNGDGDGLIVRHGFPRPPDFAEPRLVAAPASHVVEVITRGYGVMYAYADRIEPADRWAIAAYVRALQSSRGGKP